MNSKLNNKEVFQAYLEQVKIDDERKSLLASHAKEIAAEYKYQAVLSLQFICTHNSRRSQFAQVAAAYAAESFDLQLELSSGGTEATEVAKGVLEALKTIGFAYEYKAEKQSHKIKHPLWLKEIELFSKTFDHPSHQLKDSIAVMVCSHADENCPFIPGVRKRLSLPFEDPKEFDGKVNEKEAYLDSFWQICAELYFLMQCLSREVR